MIENKLSFLGQGKIKLDGLPDFYVNFVERFHLQKKETWSQFVKVFKIKSDIEDNGWRGEYWGKMMRGACLCYYYSQNRDLYDVLRETVEDLLTVQDALGRFSTYDVDSEFQGWDLWARKYVATGLFHFMDINNDEELNERILNAVRRHFDYILLKIGSGENQIDITNTSTSWGSVNSCTILEPMLELHKRTGDKKYLEFGEYIISTGGSHHGNLVKTAEENVLFPFEYPVQKAYEVMSFFEGLLAYYQITEDEYYMKVVCNFVKSVQDSEISVIGCAGYLGECMNHTAIKQTEYAEEPTQETCVTVTWIRLLTKLYSITGDVQYIHSMEVSELNALYGSINVYGKECYSKSSVTDQKTCGVFAFDSYSPLFDGRRNRGIGGLKQLPDGSYYGCCACIGAAAVALVPLTSVMKSEGAYYINTYFNGVVNAKEDFSFTMRGDYLANGRWTLTIDKTDKQLRKFAFRIPLWCKSFNVNHDGKGSENVNGYYIVERIWSIGDKIEIVMDIDLRKVELNGYTAFTYGPLTLCRDNVKEICGEKVSEVALDFSKTDFKVDKVKPQEKEMIRLQLKSKDGEILLTDYASCGKLWDKNDNQISVWLKSKALTNI